LLTAGSLGDRFGRRGALQIGMAVFGLGSLASALSHTANQLIFTRAFTGIGAAFIMPATLSIITIVFPPEERGRAIGLWAAIAGVAVALGPISGGFLLQHFYWGSIFLVNIPIVAVSLLAGFFLIPTSRDPAKPPLDPIGAVLSIAGLVTLVYAIIEAPDRGWTDGLILGLFALAIVILAAFALWERHTPSPMLDTTFWKSPRFSAASAGIMLLFFAMFGSLFLLTQYLQIVMGYSALQAGIRLLPMALTMLVVAPTSARVVERVGTKIVVTAGLGIAGIGLASFATLPSSGVSYWGDVAWRMFVMAFGMGLTMAPATESIMGSLPRAKAGVGSAVNDTTRQVGGALGVAIIGSVTASSFSSKVGDMLHSFGISGQPVVDAKESLGKALETAGNSSLPLSVSQRGELVQGAKDAFVTGMHHGVLVGAAAAFLGAIIALRWLPAHAADTETFAAQDAEEVQAEAAASAQQPVFVGEV
ncbi:MAG TPA: DHA2 family efflux MFS transporter permease subunit, partial [Acidimicrobiia bacterium]|nr:DHA2 family efflux MFS transporter permease subunit [Acidimicrobiia bacterium]